MRLPAPKQPISPDGQPRQVPEKILCEPMAGIRLSCQPTSANAVVIRLPCQLNLASANFVALASLS